MGFSAEVPVFIDTNMGTRIAMAISPEITTGDLKRNLVDEHSMCFPDMGKISTHGLTVQVKKKSNFYHLPDSIPIKNVFHRAKGAWFLRIDISSTICSNKCCPSGALKDSALYGSDVTDSQKLEDSTNCTIMIESNEDALRSRRKMPSSLENANAMKELLSPVSLYGSDVNNFQKLKDSTNCTIMIDSTKNALQSRRKMPSSLENANAMKELVSPVSLYGSDVSDFQKLEDSTNCTITNDSNKNALRSRRKMPSSLEDAMKELLSPVSLSGNDVNDFQKIEDSTNCTSMIDSNENALRSRRKMPSSLEDAMKELLSPVALYESDVNDFRKLEDSTDCTFMINSNKNALQSRRKMPSSLEDAMRELLSPVALCGNDVNHFQKIEDSTNCKTMIDSNVTALGSRRKMPSSLEDSMKELLSPVALYGSDVNDFRKPEDSTNGKIMDNSNESAAQSKRKMPTSLEDLMKELSPVAVYGSDVNDFQKPEGATSCTLTNISNENAAQSKRKRPTSIEDIMKELQSSANVPKDEKSKEKKKKKRKKKTSGIHLPIKCLDINKERFLEKNEEDEVVSSQGSLCQFNYLKKNKNKKMEGSPKACDVISVTDIITRYFSELDDVKSCRGFSDCESTHQADGCGTSKYKAVKNRSGSETMDGRVPLNASVPLPTSPNPKTPRGGIGLSSKALKTPSPKLASVPIPRTSSRRSRVGSSKTEQHIPPRTPSPTKTSRDKKHVRSDIGKRLVQAANDLGISTVKKKQPAISSKLSSDIFTKLAFDISSDSDD